MRAALGIVGHVIWYVGYHTGSLGPRDTSGELVS
jgi:hypothetical protein